MKLIKYCLLFLLPLIFVTVGILAYVKVESIVKNTQIKPPALPSISLSNLVKFSRFSLEKAPSQSLVGRITAISGDVSFESRLATEAAKISSVQDVQQGENFYTGTDGKLTIIFKDTLEAIVAEETSLKVIQTLPNNIILSQNRGMVRYKKLSQVPVAVRSYHLLFDLNGEIEISVDKVKPIITATLINGSAKVAYNDLDITTQTLNLKTGDVLVFNDDTRKAVVR